MSDDDEIERGRVDFDQPVPALSGAEIIKMGLLAALNREVLHPLGLAMAVDPGDDSIRILDDRGDPEGWIFAPETLKVAAERAEVFNEFRQRRHAARRKLLGFIVQPLPRKR